jgi:hypothetical protein
MRLLPGRVFLLAALVVVSLAPFAAAKPASAQGPRCFNETPYCIQPGPILAYWEQNGGLPVFGLPISDLQTETIPAPTQENPNATWTGPVQWFERDRLEDHSAEGVGVLAGRMGAKILELQGRPWETFEKVNSAPVGCMYFEQTGHSLCEPFLSYWQNNGGLPRFGYPITQPFQEELATGPNSNWTGQVQYFERRRMEHHVENAGTPFEVQLGLLAREVRALQPSASCTSTVIPALTSAYQRIDAYIRDQMGCPGAVYRDRPAAVQNMENGLMIWVDLGNDDKRIYAYMSYGYYMFYFDTWTEADGNRPNIGGCEGLYVPRRGFGKVWRDDPELRTQIGCAVEEFEQPRTATVQLFDRGAVIWMQDTDAVYVFGPRDMGTAQVLTRQG